MSKLVPSEETKAIAVTTFEMVDINGHNTQWQGMTTKKKTYILEKLYLQKISKICNVYFFNNQWKFKNPGGFGLFRKMVNYDKLDNTDA